MPQIKVYLNPMAANMITDPLFADMDGRLTKALEEAFGLGGKNDVAFDILNVVYTRNEAPVQIEVVYTAGEDEYKTGKIFNPGKRKKMEAIKQLGIAFHAFLKHHGVGEIVPSVWIRPQYKSVFATGKVE